MSTPSNLYAEKIFSEHPIALWALDDESSYVSFINEEQRNFDNWLISGGTSENANAITNTPFDQSITNRIIADVPEDISSVVVCTSDDLFNINTLNTYLSNMSIGMYIYSENSNIRGIQFGYEYYDTTAGQNVQILKSIKTNVSEKWFYVSETFDVPNMSTMARVVLKIEYVIGDAEVPSVGDYNFLVNGITIGQWSEEFQSTSLGVSTVTIPSNIPVTTTTAVVASSYGLSDLPGYYLINNKLICARNSGMPMVFGASNITSLSPNASNNPSLIIPGLGFLNNSGRYKEYCLEMWIRINSNAIEQKRIVGPISSTDGLYVDGPFLTLKIGENISSHFVGEWYRPMLVQINIISGSANLIVNGEQVLSMSVNMSTIDLPNEYSGNTHQDWIGFYAYQDVTPIEIDCVAIYPYQISEVVAKRRFIYGQGVEFPENINSAYSGKSVYIDYQFANYANNYLYPDIGGWNQGTIDNLSTEGNVLSIPKYELPIIEFDNKTYSEWKTDLAEVQAESDLLMTLRPNLSWSSTNGYILFNNLNILKQDVKCVYGVFKVKEHLGGRQDIMVFENQQSGDRFSITIENAEIYYKLKFDGVEETVYSAVGNHVGDIFMVGIDFEKASKFFGYKLASFFGNKNNLKLYVAGNKDFANTFIGNIYKVGLCTERNYSKIQDLFGDSGLPTNYEDVFEAYLNSTTFYDAGSGEDAVSANGGYFDENGNFVFISPSFWEYFLDGGQPSQFSATSSIAHRASYTLTPISRFNMFDIDISVDSYWEDYLPLTYFAKYVDDAKGDKYYDLDFIQFNINYPSPSKFIEYEESGSWNYSELQAEYATPVQKDYSKLDNHLISGFYNYTDLQNKTTRTFKYDTSNSLIKTYITFQTIASGANAKLSSFTTTQKPPKNGIVEPGDNWLSTKYEVVDNMIIYPPTGVDLNTLAIVTHIEVGIDGISTKPLKIKSLQYASQAFNISSTNSIGTRFGSEIYPYKKTGVYFDYKSKNPFTIYKNSSPYLYLTKNSGIQLKGAIDPFSNRGLSIPINNKLSTNYKISTIQAAIRYDEDYFPQSPMQIFEIQGKTSKIKFFLESVHSFGKRGKIYAINANTGTVENGIFFYWNGKLVKEPVMTIAEWGTLGIGFAEPINFSNYPGAFRITGPILLNSFSYYQLTSLQETQQITFRKWSGVEAFDEIQYNWNHWYPAYLWNGVLIISTTNYSGITPEDVFKTYTGTNKVIVDDTRPFRLKDYQYSAINNVSWNIQTVIPA